MHATTGNRRPTLRDVQRHVIPNYAHKWRHLGTQLEFSEAELEIIFSNFRNDSEKCCRDLVSRWLSKNPNATWDQLLTAINNLPQQSTISEFTSTGENKEYNTKYCVAIKFFYQSEDVLLKILT